MSWDPYNNFRVRNRLVKAMAAYKDSFKEIFFKLTKHDPLHPLLLPEVLEDMDAKLRQTLAFINVCVTLEGESEVFIDI